MMSSVVCSQCQESVKCDLTSAFRQKGALLPSPLHPSPHFHPPTLGRRMTVVRRLSTSAAHFGERSFISPVRPHLALSTLYAALYLCCMSHASGPDALVTIHHSLNEIAIWTTETWAQTVNICLFAASVSTAGPSLEPPAACSRVECVLPVLMQL